MTEEREEQKRESLGDKVFGVGCIGALLAGMLGFAWVMGKVTEPFMPTLSPEAETRLLMAIGALYLMWDAKTTTDKAVVEHRASARALERRIERLEAGLSDLNHARRSSRTSVRLERVEARLQLLDQRLDRLAQARQRTDRFDEDAGPY